MHVQLSLSHHFYLLFLYKVIFVYYVLNSCDRNDVKHVFWGRLLVALKTVGFSLADVQSDVICLHAPILYRRWHFVNHLLTYFMLACNCFLHWPTALSMTFCDMLAHMSTVAQPGIYAGGCSCFPFLPSPPLRSRPPNPARGSGGAQ